MDKVVRETTARLESGKYSAPALSKGLDILELLAEEPRGFKKSEIAAALDRSLSEIFRMLTVLQERGYVMLDPDSERYTLTMLLFELAHRHPPTKRLTRLAGTIMEEVAQETNQSVHLAILHGSNILVIAQTDPPGNNITSVRLGARVPIVVTASGAVLTYAYEPERREELLARIPGVKPADRKKFNESVAQAETLGYCESPSMVIEGVHNISVPVFSYAGEVIAALTMPYIRRLTEKGDPDFASCKKILIDASAALSVKLGAGAAAPGAGE
ncbi:IclR family transcriptional regulator [Pseudoruegeria sp. SHC-113]|uniref:IclR family transcriptional regulator n=1 Tax=Pseudoruegeria sp. SHC-113 TaxID=2855439 RepID=UPI0021BADC70|nr:IclR family transcriptional regulator [Pseudoruegeria sp. SHC-113]MCT8161306.1 IclR family transcriptional regulator [Pseudoruegeria sp. SHC-113]